MVTITKKCKSIKKLAIKKCKILLVMIMFERKITNEIQDGRTHYILKRERLLLKDLDKSAKQQLLKTIVNKTIKILFI